MGRAKLTLMGMYSWWIETEEDDFFSMLQLPVSDKIPANDLRLNVKHAILVAGGEFGCLYTDPSWMRTLMHMWSGTMLPVWQRYLDAIEIDYAPLENYDRKEEWADNDISMSQKTETEKENQSGSNTATRSETETSGQDAASSSNNKSSGNPLTKRYTSAYNSLGDSFAPDTKDEYTIDQKDANSAVYTESNSNNRNGSETQTQLNAKDNSRSGEEQSTHMNSRSGRAHGNIGVTTSQQMLMSELDIARYASIFNYIADDFIKQFLIMVY